MPFIHFGRIVGIAFGSFVAAWLALQLIFGVLSLPSGLIGLATFILGGLIYIDIRRRDRPAA
jgi:hypothetical protein